MSRSFVIFLTAMIFTGSCVQKNAKGQLQQTDIIQRPVFTEPIKEKPQLIKIIIEKQFLYDQHTLADTFPYKKGVRYFQWDKIREALRVVDSVQLERRMWGVLQNKKNVNRESPLVKEWHRNDFKRVADTYGVERYQGIPMYSLDDLRVPERYGRDGSLVWIIGDTKADTLRLSNINFEGEWLVPKRYVKVLSDTIRYNKVAMVDRTMQIIAVMEKSDGKWLVRSMNPATTGLHKPPYQLETPLGTFVVQEKRVRMIYLKDGSSEYGGYAPWASRFSSGGFVHGVPLNSVDAPAVEFSASLGTTPRSHMCVRTATSHAKWFYDWAPVFQSLVIVIE